MRSPSRRCRRCASACTPTTPRFPSCRNPRARIGVDTTHAYRDGPLPLLRGSRLRGPTHLRLIVADAPPFVLDVDRHTVRRIAGVASPGRDGLELMQTPGGAVALVDRQCSRCGVRTRAFLVTAAGPTRRIAIGGRVAAARKAAARWAVRRGPGEGLTLVDRASWRQRRLRWPSVLPELDGAIAEPHGPFVAIGFADPAYGGPPQAEDLFLLDTRTGALTHVPGFPVALISSSRTWRGRATTASCSCSRPRA